MWLIGLAMVWAAVGILTARLLFALSRTEMTGGERVFMSLFVIVTWPAIWAFVLVANVIAVILWVLGGK